MKTITATCPEALLAELDIFVKEGWSHDLNDAVVEALRRFLDSRPPELSRMQTMRDVEWGLKGDD